MKKLPYLSQEPLNDLHQGSLVCLKILSAHLKKKNLQNYILGNWISGSTL